MPTPPSTKPQCPCCPPLPPSEEANVIPRYKVLPTAIGNESFNNSNNTLSVNWVISFEGLLEHMYFHDPHFINEENKLSILEILLEIYVKRYLTSFLAVGFLALVYLFFIGRLSNTQMATGNFIFSEMCLWMDSLLDTTTWHIPFELICWMRYFISLGRYID